ncbi:hypothetical protein G0R83_004965 [Salmonella enterica]|uniref:Uncharacterized protein n=1 Tax=Salmonella enterica TaxID=28901 RepID=A0A749PHI4_SALER|nr:hypothetical protein [Salmonella enterica]EEI4534980.1 hypothetical protein [Salmonella enterica]EJP3911737.1 hypothetical protein [Salmonella enterica]HAF5756226.1 hypothetical protein [Salmonella enterica]
MKLIAGDIKFSESGYASMTVEVGTGTYPFLPLSICTMSVSVPLVEGKALEQYKEELLAKARERIDIMYKEIICGGQDAESLLNVLVGKIKPTEISQKILYDISMPHVDLEKGIASIEEQLSGSLDTGALNAIYAVGKKAAEDLMGKSGDEGLWDVGFRIEDRDGVLVVCNENGESEPTSEHRDKIIEMATRVLRNGNRNMLKRLGRAMGLLQVAAEIEANNQLHGSARRGDVLKDFDNPPFKKLPDDWISPGVKYLERRGI